jgi:prevent-host-death family protein
MTLTPPKKKSTCSRSSRRPRRKRGSTIRAPQPCRVALAKVKDELSRYLRMAESQEVVITRHGRPAGVLIGFGTEEDWFDYRLAYHPEFVSRIRRARREISAGRGIRLEDLPR